MANASIAGTDGSTIVPTPTAAGLSDAVSTAGQAEYVRVPMADNGLTLIPDNVTDMQALFTGDILATGFWAARISEISSEDTVLIIGRGLPDCAPSSVSCCTIPAISLCVRRMPRRGVRL